MISALPLLGPPGLLQTEQESVLDEVELRTRVAAGESDGRRALTGPN